jgi:hypothetical protein
MRHDWALKFNGEILEGATLAGSYCRGCWLRSNSFCFRRSSRQPRMMVERPPRALKAAAAAASADELLEEVEPCADAGPWAAVEP